MKVKKVLFLLSFALVLSMIMGCGGGGGGSSSGVSSSTGGSSNSTGGGTPADPQDYALAGNGQVTIGWVAVSGATSYNIYWSTSSSLTKANGTKITGATNPYTLNSLTNGTEIYYVVTAVNNNGESPGSGLMWATPAQFPAVRSVAISPNYAADKAVYVGTFADGVNKTTDGGGSWSQINSGIVPGFASLDSLNVHSLAISPNYTVDNTVYAGTEAGVWKTTNSGNSWTTLTACANCTSFRVPYQDTTDAGAQTVAISPNYAVDNTMYVGTLQTCSGAAATGYGVGVFKTTNGGNSWIWVNVSGSSALNVKSIAFSPNYIKDNTIYVGTWQANGVYKTTNGGNSWSKVNSGLATQNINSVAISPNYAADNTVYIATDSGVYKSTNGGNSWSLVTSGLSGQNVNSVVISPNYAADNTVYIGTGAPLLGSICFSVVTPGETVYSGTGVYKTTDGGNSWSQVNSGLASQAVSSVTISPNYSVDNTVYAGTSAGLYKTTNGGSSWSEVM